MSNNLQNAASKSFLAQEHLATGRRLNTPSDSPVDFVKRMKFDEKLSGMKQYKRNIDVADMGLSLSENVLGEVFNLLVRAKEIAISQANSASTLQTKKVMAIEISNIADQVAFAANTKVGNKYLYSGFKTDTKPFNSSTKGTYTGTAIPNPATTPTVITAGVNDVLNVTINGISSSITLAAGTYNTGPSLANAIDVQLDANPAFTSRGTAKYQNSQLLLETDASGVGNSFTVTGGSAAGTLGLTAGTALIGTAAGATYTGDSGVINFIIDENVTVASNVAGDVVYKGSGGGVDLFSTLETLRNGLSNSIGTDIQSSIDSLQTAMDQVINTKTDLGAKLGVLENKKNSIEEREFQTASLKANLEDVDFIAAITELSKQQTVLDTAKAVSGRILSTSSLLNFIR